MYVRGIGLVEYFFFQAEDGIRDLVRSRGLGDVYKRQTGDGIVAATKLGAAVDLMDDAWWAPSIPLPSGPWLSLIHI